jgi:NAD(P)-dependent dehydrogenase (short-subunit alcohol dehydrogenase family)
MQDYLVDLFKLKGKVAAVIGAGGYLCSKMALALVKSGVSVAILDKNKKAIDSLSEKIQKEKGKIIVIPLDVTNKTMHQKALAKILDKFKDLDILINGAGLNAPTPFLNISLKEWNAILNVHLTGTFLGCQVFGGYMVQKRKGSIINISSASAGPPLSNAFTYSVAKAGVKNLTQNLAREWAPYNVRVNAIRPGFFPTDWSMRHFIDAERKKAILRHTPMKRFGRPEELVGAALWLASEASSFVTGAEITVDGGFSAMTI